MTDTAMTGGASPFRVRRHCRWLLPASCLGLVVAAEGRDGRIDLLAR